MEKELEGAWDGGSSKRMGCVDSVKVAPPCMMSSYSSVPIESSALEIFVLLAKFCHSVKFCLKPANCLAVAQGLGNGAGRMWQKI